MRGTCTGAASGGCVCTGAFVTCRAMFGSEVSATAGPTGWRFITMCDGTTVTACGPRFTNGVRCTAPSGLLTMWLMFVMLVTCVTLTLRT